MSAACAVVADPNTAAASKSLRIATLHGTLTWARSSPVNLNQSLSSAALMPIARNKTARENPAPLRLVKRGRSALANQRRWSRRGYVAAGPAYAELDILRGQVVELERPAAACQNAIEGVALAGDGGAEIEIAIGQFDREVLVDLVGETGMRGPGETGLVRRVGEVGGGVDRSDPRAWNRAQILQPVHLVEGAADAGADERRNAPPGTEVDLD